MGDVCAPWGEIDVTVRLSVRLTLSVGRCRLSVRARLRTQPLDLHSGSGCTTTLPIFQNFFARSRGTWTGADKFPDARLTLPTW
jgi:hypothetical protein